MTIVPRSLIASILVLLFSAACGPVDTPQAADDPPPTERTPQSTDVPAPDARIALDHIRPLPADVPSNLSPAADIDASLESDYRARRPSPPEYDNPLDAALDAVFDGDRVSTTYDARIDQTPLPDIVSPPDVTAPPDAPPIPTDPRPRCTSSCECALGLECFDGRCSRMPDFSPPAPPEVARNRCVETCQCQRFADARSVCVPSRGCVCQSGGVWCDSRCVDTANDPTNCGYCGFTCNSGQICLGGACTYACPTDQARCAGRCVDTRTDPANCGACGVVCGAGSACVAGRCQCAGRNANCDGWAGNGCEVNLNFDLRHCGACGVTCAPGLICSFGTCVCPYELTSCRGACIDTRADRANCGACGNTCAAGQDCADGVCVSACTADCDCNYGSVCVGGRCERGVPVAPPFEYACACDRQCGRGRVCQGNRCVVACSGHCSCPLGQHCDGRVCSSVDFSPSIPYACFADCQCELGSVCVGMGCVPGQCPAGTTRCGDRCVDLSRDEQSCGACGHACPAGDICFGGRCMLACAGWTGDCDGNRANGCETNLYLNPRHCGGCGNACARGASCGFGVCGTGDLLEP